MKLNLSIEKSNYIKFSLLLSILFILITIFCYFKLLYETFNIIHDLINILSVIVLIRISNYLNLIKNNRIIDILIANTLFISSVELNDYMKNIRKIIIASTCDTINKIFSYPINCYQYLNYIFLDFTTLFTKIL